MIDIPTGYGLSLSIKEISNKMNCDNKEKYKKINDEVYAFSSTKKLEKLEQKLIEVNDFSDKYTNN